MRVDRRIDTIEDLLWNLIGDIKPKKRRIPKPRIHVKERGSQQVIDVMEQILSGVNYRDACEIVANNYNVTPHTIRGACTRRLGISTDEFIEVVNDSDKKDELLVRLRRE